MMGLHLAWRDAKRVRLFTRHGADFTALLSADCRCGRRACRSVTRLDGEAIVVNADGLSVFNLLRYRHHDHAAVLCAFDLIEIVDGADLRWRPVERRKAMLADLLRGTRDGIAFNQDYAGDGGIISSTPARSAARGSSKLPRLDLSLRPRRPLAQGQVRPRPQ